MNTEPLFPPRSIRAVVSDMDDTLLNDEGMLTDYTLSVLRRLIAAGIHVIPASGRTQTSLAPYAEKIGVDCPYIACNGAQLVSQNHQILEEATMSAETAKEICLYLQKKNIYVQVYRGEYFYYAEECAPSREYSHVSGMQGKAVGDLISFIDYPVPKVLAVADPKIVAEVMPQIRLQFQDRAEFTMSKPFFIEAISTGVSKGNMLLRLARRLGLTPDNTLVFGDSLNDISMIRFSKNGVAMGNARAETKAAARHVCLSNQQDGVARFLEENILLPLSKEEKP